MPKRASVSLLAAVFAVAAWGCASGYKPESRSGGFTDFKLAANSYEVRYQGNGFTRRSEVSKLLMRRCAEITLEQGLRYFETEGLPTDNTVGSAADPGIQVRIRILSEALPGSLDALIIIEETEEAAGGLLSESARGTIIRLTSQ